MSDKIGFAVSIEPRVDRKYEDCFEEITKFFSVYVEFFAEKDLIDLVNIPDRWQLPWYSSRFTCVCNSANEAVASVGPLVDAVVAAKHRYDESVQYCQSMAEELFANLKESLGDNAQDILTEACLTGIYVHPQTEVTEGERGRTCRILALVSLNAGLMADTFNLIELAPSVATRWKVSPPTKTVYSVMEMDYVNTVQTMADIISIIDSLKSAKKEYALLQEDAEAVKSEVESAIASNPIMNRVA